MTHMYSSTLSLLGIGRAIDPPGPNRLDGHYFHIWCSSVRTSVCTYLGPENKIALQGYGPSWWVTKFIKSY